MSGPPKSPRREVRKPVLSTRRPSRPPSPPRDLRWRALGAEVFGTFALTLVACAADMVAASHPEVGHAERVGAPALMVLALIYGISDVSGAHINPAVTLAFALRRAFRWTRVPEYWAAQLVGAIAGAAAARALTGIEGELGVTHPSVDEIRAVASEATMTMLLASVIVHTSKRKGTVGPQAALAVGATIALCGMWGGPLTGASMNPARSFGPGLIGHQLGSWWIYLAGPFAGAAVAVALAFAIHGPASESEQEAAEGDGGEDGGDQP